MDFDRYGQIKTYLLVIGPNNFLDSTLTRNLKILSLICGFEKNFNFKRIKEEKLKKILVAVLVAVFMLFGTSVVFGFGPRGVCKDSPSNNGLNGPAPDAGDGIPNGSGMNGPFGQFGNGPFGSGPHGPAPDAGDGVPNGSGMNGPYCPYSNQ